MDLGGLLMRLLHFTLSAVNVAGGIVLLLLALRMLVSPQKDHDADASGRDPMQLAVYPLAVPYMLNPAGIASLVILSNDATSLIMFALVIGVVVLLSALAVQLMVDGLAELGVITAIAQFCDVTLRTPFVLG